MLQDDDAPAEQRQAARALSDELGEILAVLIETIHQGRIAKVRLEYASDGRVTRHVDEADRAWPAEDRALVRGAKRIVLGGAVGVNPVLGGLLKTRALEMLSLCGLREIQIFPFRTTSGDAGVLGAALAIPSPAIPRLIG